MYLHQLQSPTTVVVSLEFAIIVPAHFSGARETGMGHLGLRCLLFSCKARDESAREKVRKERERERDLTPSQIQA